jgi:hypothetical protein
MNSQKNIIENNMTSQTNEKIITEKALDKEFENDLTYQCMFNSIPTPPFKLNNIENTYELSKNFYPIFLKEVKFCNNEWIVLNKSNNLWNKVKKPNIYLYRKLIIGLDNFKKDLETELKKHKK